MANIVTFGEILLRLTSLPGEALFQTNSLQTNFGGAEANVAVFLAKAGHSSKLVSALPNNAIGDVAKKYFNSFGVDTSSVITSENRLGCYYVDQGCGLRTSKVIYDRDHSCFASLAVDDINWSDIFNGSDLFHVSGITPAINPTIATLLLQALDTAKSLDLEISFDGNYRSFLWNRLEVDYRPILRKILQYCSIAFITEKDIELIFETDFEGNNINHKRLKAYDYVLSKVPNLKALYSTFREIKHDGSMTYQGIGQVGDKYHLSKKYQLAQIVDRIGTGDAFAAAVLHSYLNQYNLKEAVEFGAASGALKHYYKGDIAQSSISMIQELVQSGSSDVLR